MMYSETIFKNKITGRNKQESNLNKMVNCTFSAHMRGY
jgi:hypothetical protein